MHGFAVDLTAHGQVTVVALAGDIDLANAEDLKSLGLMAIKAPGVKVLEFDMSAVTFMDSSGIGALISVHNAAEPRGVTVRIGAASDPVLRVLHIAGLNEVFGVGWDT